VAKSRETALSEQSLGGADDCGRERGSQQKERLARWLDVEYTRLTFKIWVQRQRNRYKTN